jgi:U3 small nucleolar RNA-associated protein 19
MVIPFIYNLLKLHPGCMVLIHRDTYGGAELNLSDEAQAASGESTDQSLLGPCRRLADPAILPCSIADPYDALTSNPLHSNALDSSLWEIASHQKHYLPAVSSLAKIFTEVFTKPKYGMEDFLDHTYVTVRVLPFLPPSVDETRRDAFNNKTLTTLSFFRHPPAL